MAKISNNQPPVPFDASLLKKSAVARNKKLAESNKDLEAKIKELKADQKQAEKDLHSTRADCEIVFNELESAGKELVSVQENIPSAKAKLKGLLEASSETYSSSEKLKSAISKLQNKHNSLSSEISYFNEQKKEHKLLTKSLEMLKVDTEHCLDKLSKLKSSKSRFKKQTEEAAKKCNQMINKHDQVKADLGQATESFKAELKVIDKELSIVRIQCEKSKNELESSVAEENIKLDEVHSMISKAESEYLSWEKKISVAKNNLLETEDEIETIKRNFKEWKVTAVEEVARMKLRGRMENIDKAGLKDVLG
jgi:chromosome segregation ATPase